MFLACSKINTSGTRPLSHHRRVWVVQTFGLSAVRTCQTWKNLGNVVRLDHSTLDRRLWGQDRPIRSKWHVTAVSAKCRFLQTFQLCDNKQKKNLQKKTVCRYSQLVTVDRVPHGNSNKLDPVSRSVPFSHLPIHLLFFCKKKKNQLFNWRNNFWNKVSLS